jgi:integrase
VTALKRHRAQQAERRLGWGEAWHDTGLIFDRGDGSHLHHNTVRQAFKRHTTRLGLPVIRFHDGRHTAATLALADGQHPKIVQERLGHSDISMTLNRYSHVTMSMQREAAEGLERLLGG